MEDRNPNILPPFGIEKRHPHIPSSNSSQPHYDQNQNYQYRYQQQCQHHSQPPQYQQQHFSAPQVLQSQIVRGSNSTAAIDSYNNVVAISSSSRTMEYFQPQMQESYHSTAIDSYNNTVATSTFSPSAVTQNHSYTPSHALSENFQKDDTTDFGYVGNHTMKNQRTRTLIQKNPVYNETSKLCEDLSQKRKILVSLKKRKKYIECSGQCDKEEYLNDCMENVIWNQNLRDLAPPTVEVYRNAKSHDSYQNKACM
ncbi:hypothetical protein FRACYDRAFT_247239 [Fragilariopsis cylindrus CCMP1102]|uniref:Uncharacterized protein n=1 Tax=Fragilariopsis cylindrus CCMP1102 TaxID=635003 RepID=A0A1E7EW85_9STRA|nr:hypothetical protein FRACYDRAFT_247239 [Fragilariopsis cylindrus CCMP1102]|eukprot:OEU10298.1 hypothetical protein FRACYDRAFT_247239 [Fragilariopsis cylindrus CCMP1102]